MATVILTRYRICRGTILLATQQQTDYVSPGPWVETVTTRVGVDTSNDGKIDLWTNWIEVKRLRLHQGILKQIKRVPAALDLSKFPDGYAFQVELKIADSTDNKSKPIIESLG